MMAQDNSCLKRLCITFSVLYAILGVIFLFIGIAASSYKNEFEECNMENSILICCLTGSVMVALALLGSIGVYKEKKWALGVYTSFLALHAAGCFRALCSLPSVHTEPCGPTVLRYLEMGTKFAVGLSITTAFIVIISTILHLVLSCQVREKNHTRPWRSCEDATLPPYKVLHEGAAL